MDGVNEEMLELTFARLLAPSPGLVLVAGRPDAGRSTYLATLAVEEDACSSGAYWSAEHGPEARRELVDRVTTETLEPRAIDERDARGWTLDHIVEALGEVARGSVVAIDHLDLLRGEPSRLFVSLRHAAVERGVMVVLAATLGSVGREPVDWTHEELNRWRLRAMCELRGRLPLDLIDELHLLVSEGEDAAIVFRSVGPDHEPSVPSLWWM